MLIRVAFAVMVAFLLLPQEPNLSLPRLQTGAITKLLSTIRADITIRASQAIDDLRRYDNPVSLQRLDTERRH